MIRLRQVRIPLDKKDKLIDKVLKMLSIKEEELLSFKIIKESVDARKKDNILLIYELELKLKDEERILKRNKSIDIFNSLIEEYEFKVLGSEKLKRKPIIVGSGPAGLFCAYLLSENGYKPLIIERGEKVEDRIKTIEEFWESGKLNKNSNVQFGEGGAGTFSDGKLNTLVKDKEFRGKKAFEILVENGAPEEIMYVNKPHIGTNILRKVVKNIRNKIISMGGEFKYNTCLTDIDILDNKIVGIEVNNKEYIACDTLVLAIGHSARDTFNMLHKKGINIEAKPFAVGLRIEHPQEMINISQYGMKAHPYLKQACYKLTYKSRSGRGVYSFCMCPGGYVVNASSEDNKLVVNGMSNYERESNNANSAIVVTVTPKDFGNNPLDGIALQRNLEEKAFIEGSGKIPLQLYKDFKENKKSISFGNFSTCTKGEYAFSNLNNVLPDFISEPLKEAIEVFDSKIKGFARSDAILLGVESRTSSPVKILRDENGICNIQGIFPCGEGAGYSGGITTSCMDGIKVAELIAKIYKP